MSFKGWRVVFVKCLKIGGGLIHTFKVCCWGRVQDHPAPSFFFSRYTPRQSNPSAALSPLAPSDLRQAVLIPPASPFSVIILRQSFVLPFSGDSKPFFRPYSASDELLDAVLPRCRPPTHDRKSRQDSSGPQPPSGASSDRQPCCFGSPLHRRSSLLPSFHFFLSITYCTREAVC